MDPRSLHGSCARTAFAADDHPINAAKIERAEIFEERLDAQKTDACGGIAQMLHTGDAVFLVFDADAPPNVRRHGGLAQSTAEESLEAISTLR